MSANAFPLPAQRSALGGSLRRSPCANSPPVVRAVTSLAMSN